MAESVNMILEEMLPHLEELERVGIFNEVEIKNIIQRRRHYEYRMFRRPAKKDDFSRAIEYEINLNKLRKHRKEKRGVSGISQDGEFGISNRIHALYTRALKRFKGDLTLWSEHIDFCKAMNQHELLGRLYGKALAIHPRQAGLWIKAAKFEFEERNDSNSARNLFQQGLRTNSQSQSLWLEYFRMELLHVDRIHKRKNILTLEEEDPPAMSDDILSYKIGSIIYHEAVRTIPNDVEFRLSFLNILSLFEGVAEREEEIIKNIEKDFPTNPIFWDAMSRQPWMTIEHISNAQIQGHDDEIMKRYKLAFVKLQDQREDSLLLAEKFLLWHVGRVKYWCSEEATSYLAVAVENLIASYEECYKNELLTEAITTLLIESLYSMGLAEKARFLTQAAVKCYPASEPLWVLRLHSEAPNVDIEGLSKLCQNAINSIGVKNASEIRWFEINQNILRGASTSYIESLFQKSLQYDNSSNAVASLYLEWSASTGGIKSARKCYKCLLKQRPLSPEVYLKCISLERREHCLKALKVKQLLDAALEDHGDTSADLWLEYIAFEISQGCVTEVGNVYWRAMKQLRDDYIDEFTFKYALIRIT